MILRISISFLFFFCSHISVSSVLLLLHRIAKSLFFPIFSFLFLWFLLQLLISIDIWSLLLTNNFRRYSICFPADFYRTYSKELAIWHFMYLDRRLYDLTFTCLLARLLNFELYVVNDSHTTLLSLVFFIMNWWYTVFCMILHKMWISHVLISLLLYLTGDIELIFNTWDPNCVLHQFLIRIAC